jgi:hypothetical protein
VQCETDASGGSCVQSQFRALQRDPGPDNVCKMRELGAHRVFYINSLPLVSDQQVLIGRKRMDALSEAPDKVFRLTSGGLAGDCLHEREHVLGAVIDFTHQKVKPPLLCLRPEMSLMIFAAPMMRPSASRTGKMGAA